jgi:hypothetical protein
MSVDDKAVVSMCIELNTEDLAPTPVQPQQVRGTLAKLRRDSNRGRAVVCDIRSQSRLRSADFGSNELGGEVCNIDELSVAPEYRGCGLAALIEQLAEGGASLWPVKPAIRGPAA